MGILDRRENRARIAVPTAAPGELEVVRAFVSTAGSDQVADEFASPRGVARWFSGQRLLGPAAELTEEDRQRALAVRAGLRAVLAAHGDAAGDAAALARLEEAVGGARLRLQFDRDGPVGFEPSTDTVEDALAVVLSLAAQARQRGHWQHLKVCGRTDCHQAFYDASVTRTGRWCTRRCGDRVRAKLYRQTSKYKSRHRRR